MDFAEAVDSSDLEAFGFTDDFIIELWGAITDARQGRHKTQYFDTKFGTLSIIYEREKSVNKLYFQEEIFHIWLIQNLLHDKQLIDN